MDSLSDRLRKLGVQVGPGGLKNGQVDDNVKAQFKQALQLKPDVPNSSGFGLS